MLPAFYFYVLLFNEFRVFHYIIDFGFIIPIPGNSHREHSKTYIYHQRQYQQFLLVLIGLDKIYRLIFDFFCLDKS